MKAAAASADPKLDKDLRVLVRFITIYCDHRHAEAAREAFALQGVDGRVLGKRPVVLCHPCRKLLAHALVKRSRCPLDPKPACKHCPVHCYHPTYRQNIREVMRYSGRRLVLSGRLDLLYHLLF
jgi:hypothetical protein